MAKLKAEALVRVALLDAIAWQNSLANAWPRGTPERQECRGRAEEYRKMLHRRYGSSETAFDRAVKNATLVSIYDLKVTGENEPRRSEDVQDAG